MNDNERIEELEPTEETQFPEENLENDIDDEEMTGEEVQDEIQDDEEEKVKDDIEQPFYAVTPEYDELRPVLSELDYRLFLINNDLVLIGRLNGADIEIMVNSGNDEESEYTFVKAPGTLDELKKIAIDEHEYKLYTVERLCDHMAMSIQNNNKPADWYYANKDHIIMPSYGYEFYEDMLAKIPEDYDLSFHGTRTDGKPEREVVNESTLLEAKASQLRNKTKSEDPARVKKSKNVKTTYIGMSKFGILNFKTTSESRNGYHYQTVEFQSLKPFEELIKKNGKIIPTDVEKAFNEQDINVYCSDESFTYWAWYHQAYQNDYAYIDDAIPDLGKRLQAPKVNNVRLAGALCKHLYSVLEYITRPFVLLAISDDMNNFLNQKSHKYAKQTVATQNWYDAVKQWTSEDALEYLGLTKEQIIMDLSKTLKVNPTINLDDFVDDLVKDAILKRKDDIDPKLERDIANKVIDELDLDVEYENLKPEEVEHEEDIK